MTLRRALCVVGLAVAMGGLVLGLVQVVRHETRELERSVGPVRIDGLRRTDPHATEQTVRIAEVSLERGDRILVELCAASSAPASVWEGGLHAVAWMPEGETLLFRTPITSTLGERRRGARRCWVVGLATVPRTGTLAVELFWPGVAPRPEIARAPIDVRIAAFHLPTSTDRAAVFLLGGGMLLALVTLALTSPASSGAAAPVLAAGSPTGAGTIATLFIAVGLFVAATFLSGFLAGGATGLFVSGVTLALAQLAIAVWLSRRQEPDAWRELLGWRAPTRGRLVATLGSVVVAGLAVAVALLVPQLLPARGLAPLEMAIAWPSGKLAVGLVAWTVPLAEEMFFRGLLFGTLRARYGDLVAIFGSSLLFVAAHAPQDAGNPGALIAVGVTGLLLASLRAATGALWPAILAHALYDGALVAIAWR